MKTLMLTAGLGLMALAAPAAAEPVLFTYPASANYCPSGLQPIVLNGVICCGTPNTHATYSDWNRHPVQRKKYYAPRAEYGWKSPGGYTGSKSPQY